MIEQHPLPAGPDVTADDKLFAAVSYIVAPWASLLILLMDQTKERPYLRYHALQAVGFAVAAFVFEFLAAIVYCVGSAVTLGIGALCLWVLFLLPIIPALYYAYLAYQGQYFAIPYVTQLMIRNGWLPKRA